jgi:hypothetical protein
MGEKQNLFHQHLDTSSSTLLVHTFLICVILYNLVFFIAYFIITNYILKNKLNLE